MYVSKMRYHTVKHRKSEISKNRITFSNSWKSQASRMQFMKTEIIIIGTSCLLRITILNIPGIPS